MKTSFKLFTLSFIFLLGAATASAQRGGGEKDAAQMAEKQTERMTQQLSLTETQAAQVLKINQAFSEKMKTSDKEDSEARKTIRAEHDQAIKGVLTAEQLTKMEADRSKMKENRQEGKAKMAGGHPSRAGQTKGGQSNQEGSLSRGGERTPENMADKQTARMTQELSLTDKQVEKVRSINLEFASKMAAMREGGEPDRTAMKELQSAHKTSLKGVLTAEQVKKMEASESARKEGHGGEKGHGGPERH
jgi:Spy/CpxP family protein refolding chaperone